MHILHASQLFFPALVNAVGWTLLHSLWQGALAAIVTLFILSVTKRSSAATRYYLLLFVFSLFICSVMITFFHESSIANIEDGARRISPVLTASPVSSDTQQSFIVMDQTNRILDNFSHYFNVYGGFLVAVWFIFFCFHCMKFGIGLGHIYHIRHVGTNLPPSGFQETCEVLKRKLAIRMPVSLIESTRVRVPVVIGFLKPIILVPVGLLNNLPCHQVESILLHELAHIRRGDFLVNLVQSITETIFFFNPAVLWISSLIREEREACCDDIAIQELGSKVQYVEALVSFRMNDEQPFTGNALAFPGTKNFLLERVKRIISNENKKLGFMEKSIFFSGLLAIMLVASLVTAQGKEQNENNVSAGQIIQAVTDTVPVIAAPEEPVEAVEPIEKSEVSEESEDAQETINGSDISRKKLRKEMKEARRIQQSAMRRSMRESAAMQDRNQRLAQAMVSARKAEISKSELKAIMIQAELMKKLSLEDDDRQMDNEKLQELLNDKQVELAEIQAQAAMDRIESQQKIAEINQNVMEKMNHENLGRLKMLADRGSNDEVDEILDELMENDIIKGREGTSFTLNSKELIVNGAKQPVSLHNELKEKFIADKEDYITYSSKKGNTSITIYHKN